MAPTARLGELVDHEDRDHRRAGKQRSRRHVRRCACGKQCFPSERAAKEVVLEARIARVLRNNDRRREDRHYRCRFGEWHTTSQQRMSARVQVP
jgi:hypothetical protein